MRRELLAILPALTTAVKSVEPAVSFLGKPSTQQTGAAGAEQQTSGIVTNIIPKDGGNVFSGQVFTSYTDSSFVGSNLTDALKAQGVAPIDSAEALALYRLNALDASVKGALEHGL